MMVCNQVVFREYDDPNIDYEYYDTHDFGDEMLEAREKGELYTLANLGCTGFHEVCRKLREIEATQDVAKRQTAASRPYQIPATPAETLHVAEGCPVKYGGVRS
jgi:hypothetical protein